jgi:nucleotide-binding universal stress UspA family protein
MQFAKMTGGTVHLLHVARGHIIPTDISAGSGLGVRTAEDDVDVRERQVVQSAVDQLAAAGVDVRGEMIEATEHDVADVILQRAKELDVDIIVLGYQHHRGSVVAEHVLRQRPHCSILLARPPESHRR